MFNRKVKRTVAKSLDSARKQILEPSCCSLLPDEKFWRVKVPGVNSLAALFIFVAGGPDSAVTMASLLAAEAIPLVVGASDGSVVVAV